ncbi:MAG TPA: VWA domain-containing protein [Vicinamibacterales bacterium]
MRRFAAGAIVAVASAAALLAQAGQVPTVRSGVELIAVDVEAVANNGEPIPGLLPADFDVRIGGKPRKVVSADFVRYDTSTANPGAVPLGDPPAPPPRRLYLIAVDEHSFGVAAVKAAMKAASGFIDRLRPDDLVGVYAYPTGAAHVDFTTDHAQAKNALATIQGLFEVPHTEYHLSTSEVMDITANDVQVFAKVVARECSAGDITCPPAVRGEALALGALLENRVAQSLGGLRGLIGGLAELPQRKTVVLVSGGLIAGDRIGGRPDVASETLAVGREALKANVNLYVLHMDTSFLDAYSVNTPQNMSTIFRDNTAMARGLDLVAGGAGGTVLTIAAGTGDAQFDRVLKETSAHYVLGIEVDEADRDGKDHAIAVRLKRKGAILRSRTMVVIPKPGQTRAQAVAEAPDEMPQEPAPVLEKPDARVTLESVLRSASAYLDEYERQASALVSEETYLQKTPVPDPETSAVSRQLRSDMLIVPDATVGWLGFRDVFDVDGHPVQNRTERLQSLFMRPVPDSMAQARRIVIESSRYNLRSDVYRTINMPMMALRFLRFVDQRRSKFTLDGMQSVEGTRVAVVRFEEKAEPRMIESNDGAPAKGTFWIEPQSGRVMKSELLFDTGKGSARLRVRVRVGYAPALEGTWVPATMDEEYRMGKGALAVEGHATYANYRKFKVETTTTIKKEA